MVIRLIQIDINCQNMQTVKNLIKTKINTVKHFNHSVHVANQLMGIKA